MTLNSKLKQLVLVSVLLPVLMFLPFSVIYFFQFSTINYIPDTHISTYSLNKTVDDYDSLCSEVLDYVNEKRVLGYISSNPDIGKLVITKPSVWEAENEQTGQKENISVPGLGIRKSSFGGSEVTSAIPLIIENIKQKGPDIYTIFERTENNNMLRVAGNVEINGKRDIGKFIPSVNSNGSKNEIIKSILEGSNYSKIIEINGFPYITVYSSFNTENGKIAGMVMAGTRLNIINSLKSRIEGHKNPDSLPLVIIDYSENKTVTKIASNFNADSTGLVAAVNRNFDSILEYSNNPKIPGTTTVVIGGDSVHPIHFKIAARNFRYLSWLIVSGTPLTRRAVGRIFTQNLKHTLLFFLAFTIISAFLILILGLIISGNIKNKVISGISNLLSKSPGQVLIIGNNVKPPLPDSIITFESSLENLENWLKDNKLNNKTVALNLLNMLGKILLTNAELTESISNLSHSSEEISGIFSEAILITNSFQSLLSGYAEREINGTERSTNGEQPAREARQKVLQLQNLLQSAINSISMSDIGTNGSDKTIEELKEKFNNFSIISNKLKILSINSAIETDKIESASPNLHLLSSELNLLSDSLNNSYSELTNRLEAINSSFSKVYHFSANSGEYMGYLKDAAHLSMKIYSEFEQILKSGSNSKKEPVNFKILQENNLELIKLLELIRVLLKQNLGEISGIGFIAGKFEESVQEMKKELESIIQ